MTKLTQGEKNRRANIRSLKALGRKNAKLRAAAKVERYLAHVEAMNQRSVDAAAARQAKRIEGNARRDAHNAALSNVKAVDIAGQLIAIADADAAKVETAHSPLFAAALRSNAGRLRAAADRLLAIAA